MTDQPIDLDTCRPGPTSHDPRVIPGRHTATADEHDPTCTGCLPCPRLHCTSCRHAHLDPTDPRHTCPACLHQIRRDLDTIADLAPALPVEALAKGVHSEAFHLAGPTAHPEQWRQRGRHGHRHQLDDITGDHTHPRWVLATWHLLAGIPRHTRALVDLDDVTALADTLQNHLPRIAADDDIDTRALRHDLDTVRRHIERILHAGEQVDEVSPCLTCQQPITRRLDDDGTPTYRCHRCRRDLTENEYRLAVRAAYVETSDRLNADDLADRLTDSGLPVTASAIRRWAATIRTQQPGGIVVEHPPLIRPCGRDSRGRHVYRVADAYAIAAAGGDRRRSTPPQPQGQGQDGRTA